jgi:hypothetical protein
MPGTGAKMRFGVKGAKLAARHPMLRRAALRAAGKAVVKRRFREQLELIEVVARTVGETVVLLAIYGPEVAEALGLIEPPKRRRTGRVLVAGIAIGAGAVYLSAAQRRRRQEQVAGSSAPQPPSPSAST